MITREEKKQLIQQFGKHQSDSGSPQVQIAILTKRIEDLKQHLETHRKDNHSRRGLVMMVGERRKLLNYLSAYDPEVYADVVKQLKLRK